MKFFFKCLTLFAIGAGALSAADQTPPAPVLFTSRGINEPFQLINKSLDSPVPIQPLPIDIQRPVNMVVNLRRSGYVYPSYSEKTTVNNLTIGLKTQAENAKRWINDTTAAGQKVFVVGQSMGGMRAMGIAAHNTKVAGVVTIGSPVKGLTPLKNPGMNVMKARVGDVARKIARGFAEQYAWKNGYGSVPIPVGFLSTGLVDGLKWIFGISDSELVGLMKFLDLGGLKQNTNPLIDSIITGGTLPTVSDMTPGSDYIKASIVERVEPKGYYAQVVAGRQANYSFVWWWPFYQVTYSNIYKTVWVETKPAEIKRGLEDATYVLNIAGTQRNLAYMGETQADRNSNFALLSQINSDMIAASDGYNSVVNWSYGVAGVATAAAITSGVTLQFYLVPYFTGVAAAAYANANIYTLKRNSVDIVYHYSMDPGSIISEIFGGIQSHDGFIPVSDQYELESGGRGALNLAGAAARYQERLVSHFQEKSDSGIWGVGGSVGGFNEDFSVGQGGIGPNLDAGDPALLRKFFKGALTRAEYDAMGGDGFIKSQRSF